MGIGHLLLYAALAVVACWLLAELLLQNRAPLHWRAVALGGFLGVVAGMAAGSVVVIGAGALLFALGQVFVTLSVKRGYRAGWSLRRADGALPGPLARVPLLSAATGGEDVAEPVVVQQVGEVGAVEAEPALVGAVVTGPRAATFGAFAEDAPAVEQTSAFRMQELSDADGVYADAPDQGFYGQQPPAGADRYGGYQQQPGYGGQGGYPDQQWQQQQPAYGYDQGYGGYQQDPYAAQGGQQWQQGAGYQQQGAGYDGYGGQQAWDGSAQQWQQPQQPQQPEQSDQQHAAQQQPGYDYQQGTWQQQG